MDGFLSWDNTGGEALDKVYVLPHYDVQLYVVS